MTIGRVAPALFGFAASILLTLIGLPLMPVLVGAVTGFGVWLITNLLLPEKQADILTNGFVAACAVAASLLFFGAPAVVVATVIGGGLIGTIAVAVIQRRRPQ